MRPRPLTAALLAVTAVLILAGIALVISFLVPENSASFSPWLRVVTRDEHTEALRYYAVSRNGKWREVSPFAFAPTPALHTRWETYSCDFVQTGKRRVLQLRLQSTTLYDADEQPVEASAAQQKALRRIEADIHHDVMTARFFSLPQGLFVQLSLNVNWCWPEDLYVYDPAADTLTELAQFDAQEIIAISVIPTDR